MRDIFLSFVMYDADKAHTLSDLFRAQGWTVWLCSPADPPGYTLADLDKRELKGAKAIVALWSVEASILPKVREDLEELSPALPVLVLLDKAAPLPEFLPVRPFDLSDWNRSKSHAEMQNLLSHLHELIGTLPRPATLPASFEELSLAEIQESAGQAIWEGEAARSKDEARFEGVFISYRREVAAYARGLYDRLAAHFGREKVFFDMVSIPTGADFVEAITGAAESCAVMIVLISRQWAGSFGDAHGEEGDYVRLEVKTALAHKIPLVPITIQGASMPRTEDLPDDLKPIARRNACELRDVRWERDVEDLIPDLEKLLNGGIRPA